MKYIRKTQPKTEHLHVEKDFKLRLMYEGNRNYYKAQLIAEHISNHVKLYLKQQEEVFDKFMKITIEDLEDIFQK